MAPQGPSLTLVGGPADTTNMLLGIMSGKSTAPSFGTEDHGLVLFASVYPRDQLFDRTAE